MRMSDWSSDVCSSDLVETPADADSSAIEDCAGANGSVGHKEPCLTRVIDTERIRDDRERQDEGAHGRTRPSPFGLRRRCAGARTRGWRGPGPHPVGRDLRDRCRYRCRRVWLGATRRSEEHTSELQSLMRISYAGFCLKKKTNKSRTN